MSSLKFSRGDVAPAPPVGHAARHFAAIGLRSAASALARLSRRLAPLPWRGHRLPPQFEFYAEAGAPEGALYRDGELVGWLNGVQRL
ncbi:MAG TPA: hypothetical protein VNU71_21540 [Burkholderiaceae bacterium]|nr:hypothetical protein [Burkholderiaceae bacterium]